MFTVRRSGKEVCIGPGGRTHLLQLRTHDELSESRLRIIRQPQRNIAVQPREAGERTGNIIPSVWRFWWTAPATYITDLRASPRHSHDSEITLTRGWRIFRPRGVIRPPELHWESSTLFQTHRARTEQRSPHAVARGRTVIMLRDANHTSSSPRRAIGRQSRIETLDLNALQMG